jgi:hypothetical protein
MFAMMRVGECGGTTPLWTGRHDGPQSSRVRENAGPVRCNGSRPRSHERGYFRICEIESSEGESCLALKSGVVPPHSLRTVDSARSPMSCDGSESLVGATVLQVFRDRG